MRWEITLADTAGDYYGIFFRSSLSLSFSLCFSLSLSFLFGWLCSPGSPLLPQCYSWLMCIIFIYSLCPLHSLSLPLPLSFLLFLILSLSLSFCALFFVLFVSILFFLIPTGKTVYKFFCLRKTSSFSISVYALLFNRWRNPINRQVEAFSTSEEKCSATRNMVKQHIFFHYMPTYSCIFSQAEYCICSRTRQDARLPKQHFIKNDKIYDAHKVRSDGAIFQNTILLCCRFGHRRQSL